MTLSYFMNLLEDHGWDVESDPLCFTNGDAEIHIGFNEYDEEYIEDGALLCHVTWIKFTRRSMTIFWDDGDSWRYNYW